MNSQQSKERVDSSFEAEYCLEAFPEFGPFLNRQNFFIWAFSEIFLNRHNVFLAEAHCGLCSFLCSLLAPRMPICNMIHNFLTKKCQKFATRNQKRDGGGTATFCRNKTIAAALICDTVNYWQASSQKNASTPPFATSLASSEH